MLVDLALTLPRPPGVKDFMIIGSGWGGWGSVGLPRRGRMGAGEPRLAPFPRHVLRAAQSTAPGVPCGSWGREPAAIWERGHLFWLERLLFRR